MYDNDVGRTTSPAKHVVARIGSRSKLMKALATIILLLVAVNVAGQTPASTSCNTGRNAPQLGFWMWPPGSTIKLYVVRADFDASELPYLMKPVQNWNAVVASTGSRVTFDYAGQAAAPVYCENCLTIMRGPVFDEVRRHATELKAYSARGNQVLTWAHIVVDNALTNPDAIANAVAHELGHSFGLLDCYGCKTKSTVMNKLKRFNQSNDMERPTVCDVAQVKAAYRELSVYVRPAPVKAEIADEGEEAIEDDTPIIIRKP
jgi:hypothetical protein